MTSQCLKPLLTFSKSTGDPLTFAGFADYEHFIRQELMG
jgi:hypothetical protein